MLVSTGVLVPCGFLINYVFTVDPNYNTNTLGTENSLVATAVGSLVLAIPLVAMLTVFSRYVGRGMN